MSTITEPTITSFPATTMKNLLGKRVVIETAGGQYRGTLTDFSMDMDLRLRGVTILADSTPWMDRIPPTPFMVIEIFGVAEEREQ